MFVYPLLFCWRWGASPHLCYSDRLIVFWYLFADHFISIDSYLSQWLCFLQLLFFFASQDWVLVPVDPVEVYSSIFHILSNIPADAKNSFAFVVISFFFSLANLLSNLTIAGFPLKSRKTSVYFLRKSACSFPSVSRLDVCWHYISQTFLSQWSLWGDSKQE